jgi:type I restriction-modification system DNA methylase subunit
MDKQLNSLYRLFNETIYRLGHSSLTSSETIDILLFLLLWKHQSDTQVLQESLAFQKIPNDLPDNEIISIADNVITTLNLKYSKDAPDVLTVKVADIKSMLPGIINMWRGESEIDFASWDSLAIKNIFSWINDYLGSNLYEAAEFFTPSTVTSIISRCIQAKKGAEIYDPFCRNGNLLEATITAQARARGFGVTPSRASYRLARVQGVMIDSDISIQTEYLSESKKFDIVVTNPPFNMPEYRSLPHDGDWSNKFERSKSDIAFLAHSIDSLSLNGSGAVIMPTQFLSGGGVSKKMRQELIDQQILEGVITLPAGLFFGTPIPAAIIFIARGKKIDNVRMVDASNFGQKEKGKNLLFPQEEIETLVAYYKSSNVADQAENSKVISVAVTEIVSHGYDLRFNTFQRKISITPHRPSEIIQGEILELESRLEKLQKKYREIMSK